MFDLKPPRHISTLPRRGANWCPRSSPVDLEKHVAEEVEKWGKVIRAANIKPE